MPAITFLTSPLSWFPNKYYIYIFYHLNARMNKKFFENVYQILRILRQSYARLPKIPCID